LLFKKHWTAILNSRDDEDQLWFQNQLRMETTHCCLYYRVYAMFRK